MTKLPVVSAAWDHGVRKWIADRGLSRGHTEGCVLHLAATINAAAGHRAQFKAGSAAAAIYAIPDPLNLGLALAATEAVIDELEARVPGAFAASLPQNDSENGG